MILNEINLPLNFSYVFAEPFADYREMTRMLVDALNFTQPDFVLIFHV